MHVARPRRRAPPGRRRDRLARAWPLAAVPGKTSEAASSQVLWTDLLDKTQLRHYFPDSGIRVERLLGLAKSLIAYRAAA